MIKCNSFFSFCFLCFGVICRQSLSNPRSQRHIELQKQINGRKQLFQQMVLDIHRQKNEPLPKSLTTWRINSKWIMELNVNYKIIKLWGKIQQKKSLGYRTRQRVFRLEIKSISHKNKLINFTEKLLFFKKLLRR